MPRRSKPCYCPPRRRNRPQISTDCKDINEIIHALSCDPTEDADRREFMQEQEELLKYRKRKRITPCNPRPPNFIPSVPTLESRFELRQHCRHDYRPKKICQQDPFKEYIYGVGSSKSMMTDVCRSRNRSWSPPRTRPGRKVSYIDDTPCEVCLNRPTGYVQHGPCYDELVKLPSPKLSGENIRAERTVVDESDRKPPLPAVGMMKKVPPHSGIIVNRDKNYVPDDGKFAGPFREGDFRPSKNRPGGLVPCHKAGICGLTSCKKKECRMYARRRRRMLARRNKNKKKKDPCAGRGIPPPMGVDPCGMDDIPKQEYPLYPTGLRRGGLNTHSLTLVHCTKERKPQIHYGIQMGTFNMYSDRFGPKSRGKQAVPMAVMAYCLAFHYHPKQWTQKLIDHMMTAGDEWYLQLLDKCHDHTSISGICEVIPYDKKQIVNLNHKRMQVYLGEPEIVGYTMLEDPTVYNLCRGLKAFFMDHRAGILMTRILKVMLWKDSICFYMFDPAGRDSRAFSNYDKGCASLVNVKDVKALSEILLARTILQDQKFILAPVKVLKMVDEKDEDDFESERELSPTDKAKMSYRILNENCAIVNANMHMGDRSFEDSRWRQSLPIAIVAMTYAKISPPNTWYSKTLDKILKFGNKLFLDCYNAKINQDLTIDNIPNQITLGPYLCDIIVYRERVKGQLFTTKECFFNIKNGLCDFFNKDYSSGILEFNAYSLAIWKQKDMYYMFDPYARTNDGLKSMIGGRACCLMLLDTEAMAEVFTKNWDYMPATTQFYIHVFKVLRLKKRVSKALRATLSDGGGKGKKRGAKEVENIVPPCEGFSSGGAGGRGGGGGSGYGSGGSDVARRLKSQIMFKGGRDGDNVPPGDFDEEKLGDILSLVDSIQEDYVPKTPMKYKHMPPEPVKYKLPSLDSPSVSLTQIVPPWPQPRDKTGEMPEPDPDPEPPTPPTPPELPPPEGGAEEEEEEEDEDKKKERKLQALAEAEAKKKALELPPPLPPPPPSPQPDALEVQGPPRELGAAGEVQILEPPDYVERKVLLTEDAKYRYKMRQLRKRAEATLGEKLTTEGTPSEEFKKITNFMDLPDKSQIIRGKAAVKETKEVDELPFASIMAVIMSYKYRLNTWNSDIVTAVVNGGLQLHKKKKEKFSMSPAHIIPRMAIGNQVYHVALDVAEEGPTWDLEKILDRSFFRHYDRGMLTTSHYSCAIFNINNVYYLCDPTPCNILGMRDGKGVACLVRFNNLHDMVTRIRFNKQGFAENQQFILSAVTVKSLLTEPLTKLPENYDLETQETKDGKKLKIDVVQRGQEKSGAKLSLDQAEREALAPECGYRMIAGMPRIVGTTSVKSKAKGDGATAVSACHFACLIIMLMATMRPIKTWNHFVIDTCIEKANDIYEKVQNPKACERRTIKNVLLDGKILNVNIRKVIVINNNCEPTLEQYVRAVLRRVRYIIISFPKHNFVICHSGGAYHLFDPYRYPTQQKSGSSKSGSPNSSKTSIWSGKDVKTYVDGASWTMYPNMDAMMGRIRKEVSTCNNPEFYTFELTSVKPTPKHAAYNYMLSPLFKPDCGPAERYTKRRKPQPPVDEKMYWLTARTVPWSRLLCCNDAGQPRGAGCAMWKAWDIELPGDMYSLWGSRHPSDFVYPEPHRGNQYLATCVVALVYAKEIPLSAWTSTLLDGIVDVGHQYHEACVKSIGNKPNIEIVPENLGKKFDAPPYSFSAKFEKVIFGFVYNTETDRYNLSKALCYFFDLPHRQGLLVSPGKNLAFGKAEGSYYMFDCQTKGMPIFNPGQGAAYMLKAESLNRLIHCMTITLNVKRHGLQFHLYAATISVSEKKAPPRKKSVEKKPSVEKKSSVEKKPS